MSTRKQWLLVAGACVLLLAAVLVTLQAVAPGVPSAAIGGDAPSFEAPLVSYGPAQADTGSRSLASYEGRVVLLNFWATWCEPCKVEMPSMEALHRDFAPHGLTVVAMSEDEATITDADIRAYARDLGLTFEILRDTARTIQADYQVVGYPTTFVIDRDGVVRRRWVGPADWNSPANRAVMRQLLGMEDAG